jgi:hypothetical protein
MSHKIIGIKYSVIGMIFCSDYSTHLLFEIIQLQLQQNQCGGKRAIRLYSNSFFFSQIHPLANAYFLYANHSENHKQ